MYQGSKTNYTLFTYISKSSYLLQGKTLMYSGFECEVVSVPSNQRDNEQENAIVSNGVFLCSKLYVFD